MTTRVCSTSASPPPTLSTSKDDSRRGYCWFLPPPPGVAKATSTSHQVPHPLLISLIFETKPWTLRDFTENGHCILSRAFFPLSSRLANAWVPHLTSPVALPWAWVSV